MSNFERDMANTMLDAADARIASLEADKADLLRVLSIADEKIRSGEDARGQYIRENAALEARCREIEARTGPDFLQMWMRAPNPMLGGAVPIEMMRKGMGARVAAFIDSALAAELANDSGMETRADHECEPNEMDGPICMICGKSMETFVRQPIDCKHEKATIKCPDCGIDLTGNRTVK